MSKLGLSSVFWLLACSFSFGQVCPGPNCVPGQVCPGPVCPSPVEPFAVYPVEVPQQEEVTLIFEGIEEFAETSTDLTAEPVIEASRTETAFEQVQRATVRITVRGACGSGLIVGRDENGTALILTNAHVVFDGSLVDWLAEKRKGKVVAVERWDIDGTIERGRAVVLAGCERGLFADFVVLKVQGDFGSDVTPIPLTNAHVVFGPDQETRSFGALPVSAKELVCKESPRQMVCLDDGTMPKFRMANGISEASTHMLDAQEVEGGGDLVASVIEAPDPEPESESTKSDCDDSLSLDSVVVETSRPRRPFLRFLLFVGGGFAGGFFVGQAVGRRASGQS